MLEPFLKVGMLKEPLARAFYPVFHTVLVPLVGGVLSALGQAKQLKTLFLAIGQLLLAYRVLKSERLLRNVSMIFSNQLVLCCGFLEV
jgi:hypothetical protein